MPRKNPSKKIEISVIIVNYNVKDYLAHALSSIERALKNISYEIIVVDNNSIDGSVSYLKTHFPGVKLIANQENVGFGRANNQAIKKISGKYVVLINPDTLVQEDTFNRLLDFFNNTPDAAAATCKIINPDGSFSIDCRHSIPSPSIALWKVTGLSTLFPRSRIFGQYNLTFLDENEIYQVPAISGSFMMIKKEVLDHVGLFDERFFMYCEDIDLCHRINCSGYKIYYVPTTSIIHYKGESTKKNRLDYVLTFNKSLYLFFQKYYAPTSVFLFRWLVTAGIFMRAIFIYIKNFFNNQFPLLLDTLLLNIIIFLSFVIRLETSRGFRWKEYTDQFWVINVIGTGLFLGLAFYLDIYPNRRFSIQSIVKANILTFLLLAALTFFFKQFAFSRMVVLLTFIFSPMVMIGWRFVLRKYYRGDRSALGKDLFAKPTLVVGSGEGAELLFKKLISYKSIDYDLKGWVSVDDTVNDQELSLTKNLGTVKNLSQIIKMYKIRQVIFSAHSLSYEEILKIMSGVRNTLVEFKMVPSNFEVVIGKSHIEKLDAYPLLDIEYSLGRKFNQFLKRVVDISFSLPLIIILSPLIFPELLLFKKNYKKRTFQGAGSKTVRIYCPVSEQGFSPVRSWSLFLQVLVGNLSLVGAPLRESYQEMLNGKYFFKPGLTGLVQINREKINSPEDEEKYHLYYMKNQSTLLDFEIMLKSFRKVK